MIFNNSPSARLDTNLSWFVIKLSSELYNPRVHVCVCSVSAGVLHVQESGQQSRKMYKDVKTVRTVCWCLHFHYSMAEYV